MIQHKYLSLIALLGSFILFPILAPAQNNQCDLSEDQIERRLNLSFEDFDQNPEKGWRPYYENKCYGEAATLLLEYMEKYPEQVEKNNILPFHAGQMYAFNNQYVEAITFMKKGYSQLSSPTIDWNSFVDANIAFLEQDMEKLNEMREKINLQPALQDQPGVPDWAVGKKMNLDVVDGFINCFEQPYEIAYSGVCRPPEYKNAE